MDEVKPNENRTILADIINKMINTDIFSIKTFDQLMNKFNNIFENKLVLNKKNVLLKVSFYKSILHNIQVTQMTAFQEEFRTNLDEVLRLVDVWELNPKLRVHAMCVLLTTRTDLYSKEDTIKILKQLERKPYGCQQSINMTLSRQYYEDLEIPNPLALLYCEKNLQAIYGNFPFANECNFGTHIWNYFQVLKTFEYHRMLPLNWKISFEDLQMLWEEWGDENSHMAILMKCEIRLRNAERLFRSDKPNESLDMLNNLQEFISLHEGNSSVHMETVFSLQSQCYEVLEDYESAIKCRKYKQQCADLNPMICSSSKKREKRKYKNDVKRLTQLLKNQPGAKHSSQTHRPIGGRFKRYCSNRKCKRQEKELCQFKRCARCHREAYCSRKCQKEDWKSGHKNICKQTTRSPE